MRIGVISDLHIDGNMPEGVHTEDYKQILATEVIRQKLDLLLIAGDISNNHKLSHQFIEDVRILTSIPILFVPGNHDYWSIGQKEKDTNNILQYFKEQKESIIEHPYIINDEWAIVGHSGWYDYTFADKRFSVEELSKRTYNERVWQDKLNTDWHMSDRELSKKFASVVRADLEKVKDKKIILMTHIVTHRNFGVQMPHPVFDYFNAFIGSSDYDSFFQNYQIKYNIMGHVHYRKRELADGITHICACLGNSNEWETENPIIEMRHALQVIEL